MRQNRSLKRFMISGIAFAVILPAILIGAITIKMATDSLREEIILKNNSLSTVLISHIEDYLSKPLEDLLSLKGMITFNDLSPELLNEWIGNVNKSHEYFTKLQFVDNDGIVRAVAPYDIEFISIDMSRRHFFKETKRTGKTYWSPTFISPQLNIPVVTVSVPLQDGVITGYLSLTKIIKTIKAIPMRKRSFIAITDQTGTFIAHYDETKVYERAIDPNYDQFIKDYQGEITTKVITYEDEEMICNIDFIPRTGWAVVIYQSVEDVFAPVKRLFLFMSLGMIIIFIISMLLAVRHANSIMRVIQKFIQTTGIISSGNYDATIEDVHFSEFSQLAHDFNKMTESVKHRELEIIQSEQRFREFVENSIMGFFQVEKQGAFRMVNKRVAQIFGYSSPMEFISGVRNIGDIYMHPEERPEILKQIGDNGFVEGLEVEFKGKTGESVWVKSNTRVATDKDGVVFHEGTLEDITELKKAEKERKKLAIQLTQAQKMEAIGTLAGGIAHDFNNILSPIIAYSEMAMMDLSPDSSIRQDIYQIYESGKRARDLVKQILTFARKSEKKRIPLKASNIVKEAIKFIRSTIPSTINIEYNCNAKLDTILADPTQMNQIVMNLCTNAAHAMREKGGALEITLNDEHVVVDDISRFADLTPGNYLRLTVRDTGPGISPDVINNIFEPYFTTKGLGEGTGMGLAVVHGIVQNYGGNIAVESEVGKGTMFHVLLPVVEVDIPMDTETKIKLPRGNEHILFVDDEKEIVRMIRLMLEKLGYKVTALTSSVEALEAFKDTPEKYDLVITDMTMPNITGKELAKEVMTIRQGIPIILCTGYSDQIDEKIAEEMGIAAFVMKPLVMHDLATIISEVMNKVSI